MSDSSAVVDNCRIPLVLAVFRFLQQLAFSLFFSLPCFCIHRRNKKLHETKNSRKRKRELKDPVTRENLLAKSMLADQKRKKDFDIGNGINALAAAKLSHTESELNAPLVLFDQTALPVPEIVFVAGKV